MKIERIRISNFRAIKTLEFFPGTHNVLLGPNNTGKTAVLEALNLLLNPEFTARGTIIDENDFYGRNYQHAATEVKQPEVAEALAAAPNDSAASHALGRPDQAEPPSISIEAVLSGLTAEEEDFFRDFLVPWRLGSRQVVDATDVGTDPFAGSATAIRVAFDGRYDPSEDDFVCRTYFVTDSRLPALDLPEFHRRHKRQIGFLIYRDFRGLTSPVTLQPRKLFARLLSSQEVAPKNFEDALSAVKNTLEPITSEPAFASILNSYKSELERFLLLSSAESSALSFQLTDRTRLEIKEAAELYVRGEYELPLQKMGAGTRSLALLAILTLIMRRRGRGILALEEPETFLFPHAQRRVIDECLALADQTFITTHSPYVLERIPAEGVGRLERGGRGLLTWRSLDLADVKHLNLYSKRIRQTFCEALLGKGVAIVEGDSDRWWIYGASRIMNRKSWNSRVQEALELAGVCVVSADGNADLPKLGLFFHRAGVQVVCVADQVNDQTLLQELCSTPFSALILRHGGLEDLLADELPIDLIRAATKSAPHSRSPLPSSPTVDGNTDEVVRQMFKELLIANKGSAQLHEWLISQLDDQRLPPTLKEIVDLISRLVSHQIEPCKMSIL
jgi:putative ATP-dependent endonuclease of OLD family